MISIRHIQDFYVLEYLLHEAKMRYEKTMKPADEKFYLDVQETFNDLATPLAKGIYNYLYVSSMGEARHAATQLGESLFVEDIMGGPRNAAYHFAKEYDPIKNLPILVHIFNDQKWGSGYGGTKWGSIAEAAMTYGKVSDTAFIDHAVDLQHNHGSCFNKHSSDVVTNFITGWDVDDIVWFLNLKKEEETLLKTTLKANIRITNKTATLLNRWEEGLGNKFASIAGVSTSFLDWSYTSPVFGNKVLTPVKKVTEWRDITRFGNNLTLAEAKEKITHELSKKVTHEIAFLMAYSDPHKTEEMKDNLLFDIDAICEAIKKTYALNHSSSSPLDEFGGKLKIKLDKSVQKGGKKSNPKTIKTVLDGFLVKTKSANINVPYN